MASAIKRTPARRQKNEPSRQLHIMTKSVDAEYSLTLIEDAETINFTRYQNSLAWKGALTNEEYVMREWTLGKSKIASGDDNRLYVFGFHRSDDPKTLFCSVELLVRQAWSFTKDGDEVVKHNISSGCIGGVFTYPEYRGKGYARIMIDKLVELAKTQYIGSLGFLFLYSEIGEYYAKNGFKSFEVLLTHVPLTIDTKDNGYEAYISGLGLKVEPIKYHHFEPLYEVFNKYQSQKITSLVSQDSKDRISINPNSHFVDWFHLRSKYISHHNFHKCEPKIDDLNESYELIKSKFDTIQPEVFGLKLVDDDGTMIGFVVWTYEWSFNSKLNQPENYITIINLFVDDSKYELFKYEKILINLCKKFVEQKHLFKDVKQNDLLKISLWQSEVTPELISYLIDEFKATNNHENGSRSAILMMDDAEDKKLKNGDIVWEINSKLPWF